MPTSPRCATARIPVLPHLSHTSPVMHKSCSLHPAHNTASALIASPVAWPLDRMRRSCRSCRTKSVMYTHVAHHKAACCTPLPYGTSQAASSSDDGLSVGATVGIAIGGVVGILLLIGAIFMILDDMKMIWDDFKTGRREAEQNAKPKADEPSRA
eukprot:scaffold63267_cov48-Phaeocystis_antarctica.AAC.1